MGTKTHKMHKNVAWNSSRNASSTNSIDIVPIQTVGCLEAILFGTDIGHHIAVDQQGAMLYKVYQWARGGHAVLGRKVKPHQDSKLHS